MDSNTGSGEREARAESIYVEFLAGGSRGPANDLFESAEGGGGGFASVAADGGVPGGGPGGEAGGADDAFEALVAAHPDLAAELRALRENARALAHVRSRIDATDGLRDPTLVSLLDRLSAAQAFEERFELGHEIGAGGQGRVTEARDRALGRTVAIKRPRPDLEERFGPAARESLLARFLAEAQITAQLDHPGIASVHELAVDERGEPWFAMNRVRGVELGEVFRRSCGGDPEWPRVRVLNVLLRVCETLGFAHARGVVHRDLKPANVMVGSFGEVFVMDWGVARVVERGGGSERGGQERVREHDERDERDEHDERDERDERDGRTGSHRGGQSGIREGALPPLRTVRDGTPGEDSALATDAGSALGSVHWLAPELVSNGSSVATPASDVYAMGAMLYELLAGSPPYGGAKSEQEGVTRRDVLDRLRAGPPTALERCAPDTPPELIAITERAMARDASARYADMAALADDLRRYLDDRVVRAHATGAWAELRKWLVRNRRFALALSVAGVAIVAGLVGVAAVEARGREALDFEADLYRLPYLVEEAEGAWPESPERIPRYDAWIAAAERLASRLPRHRAELERLRERALPISAEELERFRARSEWSRELAGLRLAREAREVGESGRVAASDSSDALEVPAASDASDLDPESTREAAHAAELVDRIASLRPWRFADTRDQLRHDGLASTVARLEALVDPGDGLLAEMRSRRDWAASVERMTLVEPRAAWETALGALRDPSGVYRQRVTDGNEGEQAEGVEWHPLRGLVPLGADPRSGLQEFALARSGRVPTRMASGELQLDGDSALVLVLLPGGRATIGAQATDPSVPGYDAAARPEEAPVHVVMLEPFLIAKHELTQGQWARLGGGRPSFVTDDDGDGDEAEAGDGDGDEAKSGVSERHPVEGVSWSECIDLLARFDLTLPTEAQWEYAARAGTDGPFLGHATEEGLAGSTNLADRSVLDAGLGWPQARGMTWLADGYVRHAPVGSFAPNAFGLHDVIGNVWEWCLDRAGDYRLPVHPRDGLRVADESGERVARGGGYVNNAAFARVSIRDMARSKTFDSAYHGLRPAMAWPRGR